MSTNGNGSNGSKVEDKIGVALDKYLTKHPDADNTALRAEAEKVDASVSKLPARSFNAKYALQSRRRLGMTGKNRKPVKASGAKPRRGQNTTSSTSKGSKPRKSTSATKAPTKRTSSKPPKVYAASPRANGNGDETRRKNVRKQLYAFARAFGKDPVSTLIDIDTHVNRLVTA